MKHARPFDLHPSDRVGYVRRPLVPSDLAPIGKAVHTVGEHGHGSFREWSEWLRTRKR